HGNGAKLSLARRWGTRKDVCHRGRKRPVFSALAAPPAGDPMSEPAFFVALLLSILCHFLRCCRFDGQSDSLNWEARKEFEDEQEASQECACTGACGSSIVSR